MSSQARQASTYRAVRRNARRRVVSLDSFVERDPAAVKRRSVWRGIAGTYRPYQPKPSKVYQPNSKRECARRRAKLAA